MRLSGINWIRQNGSRQSFDVHLLRGSPASRDLRPFVRLDFESTTGDADTVLDTDILASQLDVAANKPLKDLLKNGKISFETSFTLRPEHAITVDRDTGAVTARVPTPADLAAAGGRIDNFLVFAVATRVSDNTSESIAIRFHLHNDIDSTLVTLSPTGLTVRSGGQPIRFGVLAQFDDAVVGDLSQDPRLLWTLQVKNASGAFVDAPFNTTTNRFEIKEGTPAAVVLTLSPTTGELVATGSFSADVFARCTIELSPGIAVQTQPAQVFSGPPWFDASKPFRVRFIEGDGINRVAQIPNVLILGDGFRAQDEPIFDELVRRLLSEIRHNPSAEPYKSFLENRSINFFSGFVPSREFGCSSLSEVAPQPGGGDPVRAPHRPKVTGASSADELVFVVGLPIPADATLTVDDAITRWSKLYGDAFTTTVPVAVLRAKLFAQWKQLTGRTLAVERDTALGVAVGHRPAASENAFGDAGLNPLRTKSEDLRLMLSGDALVRDSAGRKIPAVWKTPVAADASNPVLGKDHSRVVIVGAGLPAVGTTDLADEFSFVGLGVTMRPFGIKDFNPPPPIPSGNWRIVEPDPGPPAPNVFSSTQGTFLHELGHALAVGDEYGGSSQKPDHGDLTLTQLFGNLVLETTLRGPNPGPTDPFDITKALWGKAFRIRAAGALAKSPESAGSGQYRITIRREHVDVFKNLGLKVDDPLFLRVRPLLPSIFQLQFTDARKTTAVPLDFSLGLSAPLLFKAFVGVDDALLVSFTGSGTLPTTWNVPVPPPPFAPILLAPTLGKNSQPLTLISPLVAAQLISDRVPNSRKPTIPCIPDAERFDPDAPESIIPAQENTLSMPDAVRTAVGIRHLSRVVGAYDGGAVFNCGVFHPTGYCAMKSSSRATIIRREPFSRTFRSGGTTEYCHVCRYLLVDLIDPSLHGKFDNAYTPLYVEGP